MDAAHGAPYATTQAPMPVHATDATLNGMVTPNGEASLAWFEWGTTGNFGNTTTPVDVGSGTNVVRVSAPVSSLTFGGIYSFRLVVSNASGVARGAEQRFTTGQGVYGWGDEPLWRENLVPGGLSNVVAVSASGSQTLVLKNDGTVLSWGSGSMTNVPAGLSGIVAVSAGDTHSLALKSDGTVVAWGQGDKGQTNVPAGLTNVVAVAAGYHHSLALQADGHVAAWGFSQVVTNLPVLENIVAIGSGADIGVVLKNDGRVIAWGDNSLTGTNVPADLTNVSAFRFGFAHGLALKNDGTVRGWGYNISYQADPPAGLSNVICLGAGLNESFAVKADGTAVGWGANSAGQRQMPYGLSNIVAVAGAAGRCVLLCHPPLFVFTAPAKAVTTTNATLCGVVTPNGYATKAWFEWGTNNTYGQTTSPVDAGDGAMVVWVTNSISGLDPGRGYSFRIVASNALHVEYGAEHRLAAGMNVFGGGKPYAATNVVAISGTKAGSRSYALRTDGRLVPWSGGVPSGADQCGCGGGRQQPLPGYHRQRPG